MLFRRYTRADMFFSPERHGVTDGVRFTPFGINNAVKCAPVVYNTVPVTDTRPLTRVAVQ